jgi:surface polysaccharide O-acyltransferase-like enzyme
MYALIPLYILSPFIKKLVDSLGRDLVVYLLAIWVFFSSLLPTVAAFLPASFSPVVVLDRRYDLSFMAGYAGYFLAGYYLMRMKRAMPVRRLALAASAMVVLIALGTWWKTNALGKYAEIFKTYTGIFVVVLSCLLFLLAKESLRSRRLGRATWGVVGFLAPLAFGVYLLHNLVVDFLSRLFQWWPARSVPMVIWSYLAVLAVSVAAIFVLSRLKPLSYVFTGQVYGSWRRPKATPGGPQGDGGSGPEEPDREEPGQEEPGHEEPDKETVSR